MAEQSYWWEIWGCDLGDKEPVLLMAFPEGNMTPEHAKKNAENTVKMLSESGYTRLEAKRVLRDG